MDKAQEEALRALKAAYVDTFSTPAGKKVMEDLEKRCFFHTTSYVLRDPETTIFNEGTRANVLYMKTMMDMDIDRIKALLTEGEQ